MSMEQPDDCSFLYEDITAIRPIIIPAKDPTCVSQEHRNQVIMATVFVVSDGLDKEDKSKHVILKVFPSDIVSEDREFETYQMLRTTYHHALKKFYDYRISDYISRQIFYESKDRYVKKWYDLPLQAQVFVRYSIAASVGCQHYMCGCLLECPDCHEFFGCRICHNNAVDDHTFRRYDVEKVKCRYCGTVQPFQQTCIQCKVQFGKMYCYQCRLISDLDSNSKPFYHCNACGECVIGTPNHNIHCKQCKQCYSISNFQTHKCVKIEETCCVCLQQMANSNYAMVVLNCYHQMHYHCYQKLIDSKIYGCPVCRRFMPMEDDQEVIIEGIADYYCNSFFIEMQGHEILYCNDCQRRFAMPFNYVKYCPFCNLFNAEPYRYQDTDEYEVADLTQCKYKMLDLTPKNVAGLVHRLFGMDIVIDESISLDELIFLAIEINRRDDNLEEWLMHRFQKKRDR